MRAIRNNLAIILIGIIAVVLIVLVLRLQSLILLTQQGTPVEITSTVIPSPQQPTILVTPATVAAAAVQAELAAANSVDDGRAQQEAAPSANSADSAATSGSDAYQHYGSTIVGAIHVGSTDDRGFNQANNEALRQMVRQIPNTRLISAENIPETAEVVPVIEDFIARGAQVIFTQSFGYLPYALEIAERHPEVVFMNAGGFDLSENVGTYGANHVETMYLTGMAAGAVTQSNQLGFISAFPIPSSLASVNAFHLGARSVNPDITTRIVNNGAWVDPVRERHATEALASIGVDVVAMIVDSPIAIVETAQERGMYVIGFHSASLQELAPDQWLTGVEHTWNNFFTQIVEQARAGQWQSGHARGGIESDMFRLASFGPAVSEEMQERILTARDGIINGRLHVFEGPIVDNLGITRVPDGEIGELVLLDSTDWLVEGVNDFDVDTVEIQPLVADESVAEVRASDEGADLETVEAEVATAETPILSPTAAPAPTATEVIASSADFIFGLTDDHPQCDFFTETAAQIVRTAFGVTVEIVHFPASDELYNSMADRHIVREVDLTLCHIDPTDRPFLREHFGYIKHVGDAYWETEELRLQILSNTSFIAELEQQQNCVYRFLRNIHFEQSIPAAQTATEWIASNPALVDEWINCVPQLR